MIQIGTVKTELAARQVTDTMFLDGIEARADENKRGDWDIWVVDMDQEAAALRVLKDFEQNPEADHFATATLRADEKRKQETTTAVQEAKPVFTRANMPGWTWRSQVGPVTGTLMTLSILITLLCSVEWGASLAQRFFYISRYPFLGWDLVLPEVQQGEVWRLITPIFLHARIFADLGVLHILFNMMWLKDLGGAVERKCGALIFTLIVLAIGVVSNLGQYLFWGGPFFGGMSGVVYGLLGFVWIQGKLKPFSGFHVSPQVMNFMMIWLVFGFVGAMPIANGCHLVGLLTGLALGALPVPVRK